MEMKKKHFSISIPSNITVTELWRPLLADTFTSEKQSFGLDILRSTAGRQ